MDGKWIREDWKTLLKMLPAGWREQAGPLGALIRPRKIKTPEELLRLLLMHVGPGLSLVQAVMRAAACGLPKISDVALMERLKRAEGWLRWMCQKLLEERLSSQRWADLPGGHRFIAVDSTCIQEPGATGSDWRLHYAVELPSLFCQQAKLTERTEGESLMRYEVRAGDVLLGDRNYCKEEQIKYVLEHGGHVTARWHRVSLPLLDEAKAAFDVAAWTRDLKQGECLQQTVRTKTGVLLRLCAVRASKKAARASVREHARKDGRKPSAESLALADFIIIVTSLPQKDFSAHKVMALYRLRWQIELAFKRLKSLLGTGHVPKLDPESSRAWLQAKLLTCLLIEKLLLEAEVFSPWGYLLPEE